MIHSLITFALLGALGCNNRVRDESPTRSLNATAIPTNEFVQRSSWSELRLPPGCRFIQTSPDWKSIFFDCRQRNAQNFHAIQYAKIRPNGELENIQEINNPLHRFVGFTSDGLHAIHYENADDHRLMLFNLATLQSLYPTKAVTGVRDFANELAATNWSADGTRFLGTDCFHCYDLIQFTTADQHTRTVVSDRGHLGSSYDLHRDGNQVAYVTFTPPLTDDFTMTVNVLDLRRNNMRVLLSSDGREVGLTGVRFSPVDSKVAVRTQNNVSETAELHIVDLGSNERTLYTFLQTTGPEIFNGWGDLVWSPDGKRIALLGHIGEATKGYFVVEVATGKITHTGSFVSDTPLYWSKDNKAMLILRTDSKTDIQMLRWVEIL